METPKDQPSLPSLSGRPALKTFLSGAMGAAIFGIARGHAKERFRQEAKSDELDATTRTQVENSLPVRFRNQAQNILGKDLFDRKTANEYTEFGYSFFSFMMGVGFVKPLLDRLFPDKKTEPEQDSHQEKRGFFQSITHRGSQLFHTLVRYPLAAAAALVPYALMGKLLDNTLLNGKITPPEGMELTPIEQAKNALQNPFARMLARVGVMFSTFNIAHRLLSRGLNRSIGAMPGSAPEMDAGDSQGLGRLARDGYNLAGGVVLPVMVSVTPLVSTLFFTNQQQKTNYDQRIADKLLHGTSLSTWDHLQGVGFKAGEALNQLAGFGYRTLAPSSFKESQRQNGISPEAQEGIAAFALASALAYGSFAATRNHAVEPFFKRTLGINNLPKTIDVELAQTSNTPSPQKTPSH